MIFPEARAKTMGNAWTAAGEHKVRVDAPRRNKNKRSKSIGKSPNPDDCRSTRTEQARRIARHWVTHIERLQSSQVSLKSLELDQTRTRPNRKRRYKELKANELYSELGRTFLIGLIDMRRSSDFYNSHPKGERSEQVVRESAVFMLMQIIKLVWPTNRYLDLGLNVEPLMRLQRAISDVVNGSNDRLLVTGELADRLVDKRFSRDTRRNIEARAAGTMELLLRHGHAKSQIAAAILVAKSLKNGGFSSPGRGEQSLSSDTVKRWHNRAKDILKLADRTSYETWTSPTHESVRCFHDTYLSMLMPYEAPMVEEMLRRGVPIPQFDADKALTDLSSWCWEARTCD